MADMRYLFALKIEIFIELARFVVFYFYIQCTPKTLCFGTIKIVFKNREIIRNYRS